MLGICVVYLVSEVEGYDLLTLSLEQINRHTLEPYRVYGCCPNNDAKTLELMHRHNVEILPAPERHADISQEHSRALDLLTDKAVKDGCTHVATFDMDSWPVFTGWDRMYANAIGDVNFPLVSIVRTEMSDNFPFAAFTMFGRDFWCAGGSSFSTKQRAQFDEIAADLSSRPGETGSGILAHLHRNQQSFLRLERSNHWNFHPIIAGLYDNTIFHLGAGSRKARFMTDDASYTIGKSAIRRAYGDAANQRAREFTIEQLLLNHDEFVLELAGGGLHPLRPLPTDPQALPKQLTAKPLNERTIWSPL
jgi:hypothetical protein